jgi:leucyl aminopeptidase
MTIRMRKEALSALKTDLYIAGLFKDEALPEELRGLEDAFGLGARLKAGDFKGARGERLLAFPREEGVLKRVLLLGLGERERFGLKTLTAVLGDAFVWLRDRGWADVVVELPLLDEEGPAPSDLALVCARAARAGSWQFEDYKSEPRKPALKRIGYRSGTRLDSSLEQAFRRGDAIGRGVNYARDLAQRPGGDATPGHLADCARGIAAASPSIKATVLGEAQLRRLGAGGILAVGQGSTQESRLIALEYRSGRAKARKLAVIGKGITFDSGGISIKPAAKMEEMKYDMCGAAAVLGLFSVLAELKPAVDVVGVVPAAENMPDGGAYRPGDVLRLLCGKTVEVVNTDAEGRLLLCDALAWAERTHKPDAMVDLATLTGAVLICLGHEMSAVMGNDPAMVEAVVDAGARSGDTCWPLPLADEYKAMVKSGIADIRNSTNLREAGTITAGAFLNEAVGEGTPWAHLDIAGTAWMPKKPGLAPNGPSGVGVHLLVELIEQFAD